MSDSATYPEFNHKAKDLTKYIEAAGTFSLLLKNGNIVHYKPINSEDFRKWLTAHKIPNLRDW